MKLAGKLLILNSILCLVQLIYYIYLNLCSDNNSYSMVIVGIIVQVLIMLIAGISLVKDANRLGEHDKDINKVKNNITIDNIYDYDSKELNDKFEIDKDDYIEDIKDINKSSYDDLSLNDEEDDEIKEANEVDSYYIDELGLVLVQGNNKIRYNFEYIIDPCTINDIVQFEYRDEIKTFKLKDEEDATNLFQILLMER